MNDKRKVLILLSSYNGGEKIRKQIDSILSQINVDVNILVRDDGSTDDTKEILRDIEIREQRVKVLFEKNIGWKRSFLELVYSCSTEYDYFGFSDQDDIWFEDKVFSLIDLMESDEDVLVKMGHCNSQSVDEKLNERAEQEYRRPYPLNYKSAIANEFFQGCGMLWNKKAMELIRVYKPKNVDLAHDYWVGLICFLFGKVYFLREAKFYHIRYDNNSSEDGNVWKGRIKRFKLLANGKQAYMNPSSDLIQGYSSFLDDEILCFLKRYSNMSFRDKLVLFLDPEFRRNSIISTVAFKIWLLQD